MTAIRTAAAIPDPAERAEALHEAVAQSNLATLRASLIAAGWTAESPDQLDAEAEYGYLRERADYDEGDQD